ncbi:MAG: hypothetical protein LQ340_005507 [Diploschistes diacapsis]|nr:MAG: hypothetical protein LQ340_005507 [Diploschistes diacapsis]
MVLPEDVAGDDARLRRLGDVADAGREDGVAEVGLAILGDEADEALEVAVSASGSMGKIL